MRRNLLFTNETGALRATFDRSHSARQLMQHGDCSGLASMFAATQALHAAKPHSSHFALTPVRRVQIGHSSGTGGAFVAAPLGRRRHHSGCAANLNKTEGIQNARREIALDGVAL